MIIDSSALVAILLKQTGHERLVKAIFAADTVAVSAVSLLESSIVVCARRGPENRTLPREFVREGGVGILAFDDAHLTTAIEAFHRYGKGRHPAALNFGDCASYATASLARQPLLFVGDDFAKTDIAIAAW